MALLFLVFLLSDTVHPLLTERHQNNNHINLIPTAYIFMEELKKVSTDFGCIKHFIGADHFLLPICVCLCFVFISEDGIKEVSRKVQNCVFLHHLSLTQWHESCC